MAKELETIEAKAARLEAEMERAAEKEARQQAEIDRLPELHAQQMRAAENRIAELEQEAYVLRQRLDGRPV